MTFSYQAELGIQTKMDYLWENAMGGAFKAKQKPSLSLLVLLGRSIHLSPCTYTIYVRTVTEGVDYIYRYPTMRSSAQAAVILSLTTSSLAAYDLVKTYSGNSFFDSWSYYGHWDNLTSGVPAILVELRSLHRQLS